MPKGYVIFAETVNDQAGMDAYQQKAIVSLIQAGGRPIVVHDDAEVLEGQWGGSKTVVLEFDSVDAARAWYQSPDYQAAIPLRRAAANSNVVIVGGFEMPGS
jgi:uncharacterized protein (DUF1330 family)